MPFAVQATQKKLRPFDRTLYLCNMGVLHILGSCVGLIGRKRPCGSDACWAACCILLPVACEKKCCLTLNLPSERN